MAPAVACGVATLVMVARGARCFSVRTHMEDVVVGSMPARARRGADGASDAEGVERRQRGQSAAARVRERRQCPRGRRTCRFSSSVRAFKLTLPAGREQILQIPHDAKSWYLQYFRSWKYWSKYSHQCAFCLDRERPRRTGRGAGSTGRHRPGTSSSRLPALPMRYRKGLNRRQTMLTRPARPLPDPPPETCDDTRVGEFHSPFRPQGVRRCASRFVVSGEHSKAPPTTPLARPKTSVTMPVSGCRRLKLASGSLIT